MYTKNLIDRYSRSFPWRTEVFYRKIGIICARDFKGPPLRSTVVGPTPAPTLYQRIVIFSFVIWFVSPPKSAWQRCLWSNPNFRKQPPTILNGHLNHPQLLVTFSNQNQNIFTNTTQWCKMVYLLNLRISRGSIFSYLCRAKVLWNPQLNFRSIRLALGHYPNTSESYSPASFPNPNFLRLSSFELKTFKIKILFFKLFVWRSDKILYKI